MARLLVAHAHDEIRSLFLPLKSDLVVPFEKHKSETFLFDFEKPRLSPFWLLTFQVFSPTLAFVVPCL